MHAVPQAVQHSEPVVPRNAASAAGALDAAMARDKRRRIQAAVDAGSESEGDEDVDIVSYVTRTPCIPPQLWHNHLALRRRSAIRAKAALPVRAVSGTPAPGSRASGHPQGKKKKKKRKGAYANVPLLGRR